MFDILSKEEIKNLLKAFGQKLPSDNNPTVNGDTATPEVWYKHISSEKSKELYKSGEKVVVDNAPLAKPGLEGRLVSVDELYYEEFIHSIPNPTYLQTFTLGSQSHGVAEISPTIMASFLPPSWRRKYYKDRLNDDGSIKQFNNINLLNIFHEILDGVFSPFSQYVSPITGYDKKEFEIDPMKITKLHDPATSVALFTYELTRKDLSGVLSIVVPSIDLISQDLPESYATVKDILDERSMTLSFGKGYMDTKTQGHSGEFILLDQKAPFIRMFTQNEYIGEGVLSTYYGSDNFVELAWIGNQPPNMIALDKPEEDKTVQIEARIQTFYPQDSLHLLKPGARIKRADFDGGSVDVVISAENHKDYGMKVGKGQICTQGPYFAVRLE